MRFHANLRVGDHCQIKTCPQLCLPSVCTVENFHSPLFACSSLEFVEGIPPIQVTGSFRSSNLFASAVDIDVMLE